jgi:hypothetical protein
MENNFLGRALCIPLVWLCFTLFIFYKLTVFDFFLHLIFIISYSYFYYEDLKQAFGVEKDPLAYLDESGFNFS